MKLNPRQEKFCEVYATKGNATRSYLEVYEDCEVESARRAAALLLTNVDIKARVEEIKAELANASALSREEIVRRLCDTITAQPDEATADNPLCELKMTKAGPAYLLMDKMAAIKELNRMVGNYEEDKRLDKATDALAELLGRIRDK